MAITGEKPRLSGHIAIVTGSDSGIGKQIAIAFAEEGADIALARHKDAQGVEETKSTIEALGRKAVIIDLEQTSAESVKNFVEQTKEQLGTPTLLVNDAGIDATGKEVKDINIPEWEEELKINVFGPFYFCHYFLQQLTAAKMTGSIINITSVHQDIPRGGASGYCASKGALKNLTECLALETAESDIRVNNIAPGMVLTPMNQSSIDDPKMREQQTVSIPVKRAAEPEEIATVAVFLASEDARYIHGETIFVDGALRLYQGQGA